MRSAQLQRLLMMMGAGLVAVCFATAASAQTNLTKEVMDKKGAIVWKNAPATAIPQDVCSLLAVCAGPIKLIVLPKATEGGATVGRGLFLTQDAKHADVVVLEHQTLGADTYFMLLKGDGSLDKAAYAQVTSTSWQLMGSAAQPTFEKDKVAWQKGLEKLGNAPPAAAADKKDAPVQ